MKDLKQKVIELGIERGYLPKNQHDSLIDKFNTQYLRLLEEIGEASKELRLENEKEFKMELGDCLVLHTNCNYIVKKYLDVEEFVLMMDNVRDSIDILTRMSQSQKWQSESNYHRDKQCLQMAYNKIIKRGGILIGEDWFKPTDKEYQEAKLHQLKERFADALTINPKYKIYKDDIKEIHTELHSLSALKLDEDDVKLLIQMETETDMILRKLKNKEV